MEKNEILNIVSNGAYTRDLCLSQSFAVSQVSVWIIRLAFLMSQHCVLSACSLLSGKWSSHITAWKFKRFYGLKQAQWQSYAILHD